MRLIYLRSHTAAKATAEKAIAAASGVIGTEGRLGRGVLVIAPVIGTREAGLELGLALVARAACRLPPPMKVVKGGGHMLRFKPKTRVMRPRAKH